MTHPTLKQKENQNETGRWGRAFNVNIFILVMTFPSGKQLFCFLCITEKSACLHDHLGVFLGFQGPEELRMLWDFPVVLGLLWRAQRCLHCGVHVQGGRESREERDTQLRREGGTTVCPKSTTGLDM